MIKLSFESGCLAKKNPGICIPGSLPSELLIARNSLRPLALEKLQWFRTDSGTSYQLSKSEAPLSSRKAHLQLNEYAKGEPRSQHLIHDFHRHHQPGSWRASFCFAGVAVDAPADHASTGTDG